MLEGRDGLRDAVFKDLEVVLLEVGHQMAVFVEHGDVQDHLIHVALQGETAMRPRSKRLSAAIGRAGVVRADRLIVLGVGGEDGVAVYIQWRLGFGLLGGGCLRLRGRQGRFAGKSPGGSGFRRSNGRRGRILRRRESGATKRMPSVKTSAKK